MRTPRVKLDVNGKVEIPFKMSDMDGSLNVAVTHRHLIRAYSYSDCGAVYLKCNKHMNPETLVL
jgi:hypothetical protein